MTEESKIVVEIPQNQQNNSIVTQPIELSKLEKFNKGWADLISFSDNPADLMYEVMLTVVVPALFSNAWSVLPLPGFLRVGLLLLLCVFILVIFQLFNIQEVRSFLLIRLTLILTGILVGA